MNPTFDAGFDGFAAPEVRGNPKARTKWAIDQVKLAAKACRNLGLDTQVFFTGAFCWPFIYPWPQRLAGLVESGFDELAVLEWECCLKHPEDGAREGAEFIRKHIIRVTEKAFDDFAAGGADQRTNRRMLGIG